MMALQILPILQVIVILSLPTLYAYPVYGTKRFGHNFRANTASNSDWYPYTSHQQPMVRTQRYPMNYYEMYPEDRYYYPQEPVYYPRTSKYEVYQAVMPYYYADNSQLFRPAYGYGYGYGDNADLSDIEEEMIQDVEREQRENAQPIGHETYYENDDTDDTDDSDDNIDKINAAFLQNLIMSQMYDDGKFDKYTNYDSREDEDVRELKELAKPLRGAPEHPSHEERLNYFHQKTQNKNKHPSNNWDEKRSVLATQTYSEPKHMADTVFGKPSFIMDDRKPIKVTTTTTDNPKTSISSSTVLPKRSFGQKEEVLLRPATPVRRPFSQPIMDMLNIKDDVERKRVPSVYDTIKHMLEVEEKLDKEHADPEMKPAMRKRIISSEESLTKQLSVLKKQ